MKTAAMLLAFAMFAVTARAQNFSGHWAIEMPGRGGQVQKTPLDLNQNGSVVTGTLGAQTNPGAAAPAGTQIWGGKAEGNTVTFYVWRGSDKPWKQIYTGTISGDEITFTITGAPSATNDVAGPARGGNAQNASAPIVAKRSD